MAVGPSCQTSAPPRTFRPGGRNRLFGWVLAAVCVVGATTAPEVRAQPAPFDSQTTITAPPRPIPDPPRLRATQDPTLAPDPGLPSGSDTTIILRPSALPPAPSETDAKPDPTGDDDQQPADLSAEPGENNANTAQRPTQAPADGDFRPQVEPPQPVDGDFTVREPTQPVDGILDPSIDQRSELDRAEFEGPPVGYDPSLFAIDVTPILSERPRQLFRFSPFVPLGIRAGSFVMFPTLETALVYDDNVFDAEPNERDVAIEVLPSVRIVSNWSVHAIELSASGVLTRFQDFSSEDINAYAFEARGRLDVLRRTNFEGLISTALSQESRSDIDAGPSTSDRADVRTNTAALTFNHRFNRLGIQLRGGVSDEDFSDTATVSNDDRDERIVEGAVRSAWEFKPTLVGFAEIAFLRSTFGAVSSDDGLSRDSRGERYRAGVSFGNTDQILRGEISVGFGQQRPDDNALKTIDGVLLDANLAWRVSGLTTLLLTATTDFNATTTAGSAGSIERTVGLGARHAFREYLIGTMGVTYGTERFEGIDIVEREWEAQVALEYLLSRDVALFTRYQFTDFDSDDADRAYRDHELRVGFRLQR